MSIWEGCPATRNEGRGQHWLGEASRDGRHISYLPPVVGDPGAPAAVGGERLGPAGPPSVASGPYWPSDPRVHPAAGSGASKKLQRRWPEPVPGSAGTHTVAASCLQRKEGWSSKAGLTRHPKAGARTRGARGTSVLAGARPCGGVGCSSVRSFSPAGSLHLPAAPKPSPFPPHLAESQQWLLSQLRAMISKLVQNVRPCEWLCRCLHLVI